MDPEYDPSHKTSSITSTTSTNSWDTVPSLTASSICDVDSPSLQDHTNFEEYSFAGERIGLTMPFDDFSAPQHDQDVLTDHDQKTFTDFLDTFFIDGKPPTGSTYDCPTTSTSTTERAPIFLHQSHEITIPHMNKGSSSSPTTTTKPLLSAALLEPKTEEELKPNDDDDQIKNDDDDNDTHQFNKRPRSSRDLLTDDEKRANHIASEQKRRNTIRTGFKEMTEIIPTLKNINNSKSTILFKAVEYIKHLDKRNRGLREKLSALQIRLEVEGRMGGFIRAPHQLLRRHSHYYNDHQPKRSRSASQQLPPEAMAALLAHKNQQKQLEILQEQLRYQQELLAKHNIPTGALQGSNGCTSSRHLSIDERLPLSVSSSSLYNSISIPMDHHLHHPNSSPSSSKTALSASSSSSSSSALPLLSKASSIAYQRPSVHTQFSTQRQPPQSQSQPQYHHHHRQSAPALIMPNMSEDNWQHHRHDHASSTASPLGVSSFNIPADDGFHRKS